MKQIICIGSACKDIFFPTVEGKIIETPEDLLAQKKIEFELGAKYKTEERYEALGGCAANVAVGLAKLGMDASCYSHIGNDYMADWILNELQKNKVNVDLVTKDSEFPSDMSAIIVDKNSGERVIFSNQKSNAQLEIDPEKLAGAEWVFIGDLHGDWEKSLETIVETAQTNQAKIIFNPRQSNIHDDAVEVLKAVAFSEILFLNKDEAMELASAFSEKHLPDELKDEKFLVAKFKELGATTVVVTDGINGAWAANDEEDVWLPAQKVLAIDSTGAGDAFSSGFSAAYIQGKKLEECMRWGIANSSNSVEYFGGVDGLLSQEQIEKK